MDNIQAKADFLKNDYVKLLSDINPDTKGVWGKMNVHQMIEHMSYSFRQANGKDTYTLITPEENVPKMQAFLMSEKPFRENTPNVLIGDNTIPVVHSDIKDSLKELQNEINHFFEVYKKEGKTLTNPFFGSLDYTLQVQLLHKHAWHHLRQFGVEAN
ncbi:MAG: hypothetical protein JST82_11120 [Bacteroidetes bacterium]|nr:hypothetical protein [Bacteroidota bacterium]